MTTIQAACAINKCRTKRAIIKIMQDAFKVLTPEQMRELNDYAQAKILSF